jgi:HD-GYP domain-containing protein (c-di-GMP phosphodiesterase class II)
VPFLEEVSQLVLLHHEHVDGLGYPRGLRGDAIPLEARIVGVADAVDAFHSERAHREALGNDEIARELAIRRGSVFDSSVVDAAIASIDFHT